MTSKYGATRSRGRLSPLLRGIVNLLGELLLAADHLYIRRSYLREVQPVSGEHRFHWFANYITDSNLHMKPDERPASIRDSTGKRTHPYLEFGLATSYLGGI